jgi:hypothetical protein
LNSSLIQSGDFFYAAVANIVLMFDVSTRFAHHTGLTQACLKFGFKIRNRQLLLNNLDIM